MVAEKLTTEKTETEHNLTISTKLSTDQLICKSPQTQSSNSSVKSLKNVLPVKFDQENGKVPKKKKIQATTTSFEITTHLALLQIVFGLLMMIFGGLVLVHNASLSHVGGGLWGGSLATLTGILGVLSTARQYCPLKPQPQRMLHTAFLALSLICLAVAQLVLVLAAIGIARDAAKDDENKRQDKPPIQNVNKEEENTLSSNYTALLTGIGLLLISGCECIVAALSAYRSARALCPCFVSTTKSITNDMIDCSASTVYAPSSNKDFLVSNWLGKQQLPPDQIGRLQSVYVVKTNKTKLTPVTVAPIYPLPTQPPVVGYPLIPAPLGPTPPPILRPMHYHPVERVHRKPRRYPSDRQLQQQYAIPTKQNKPPRKKKSHDKEKTITTEDVARTYTGLDRVIAEEFIEICDSTKNTNTSCSDSSRCTASSSDSTSNGYVHNKL